MHSVCYICNTSIHPAYDWSDKEIINCPVCGKYKALENFLTEVASVPLANSYVISGAIREKNSQGIIPTIQSVESLLSTIRIPKDVFARIDRLLLYMKNSAKTVDEIFKFTQQDYPITYSSQPNELYYFIRIAIDLIYIEKVNESSNYRIGVNGWKRLQELESENSDTTQAFIAMSFNPELFYIWTEAFQPALERTGYAPLRLDRHEHNDKIDDQILAQIRKSRIVIADFTENKAGVYFEAGFAAGLGIPVIWTCRKDSIEAVHFDTRQYNYIVWETTRELFEKLTNRVEALYPIKQ